MRLTDLMRALQFEVRRVLDDVVQPKVDFENLVEVAQVTEHPQVVELDFESSYLGLVLVQLDALGVAQSGYLTWLPVCE